MISQKLNELLGSTNTNEVNPFIEELLSQYSEKEQQAIMCSNIPDLLNDALCIGGETQSKLATLKMECSLGEYSKECEKIETAHSKYLESLLLA